MYDFTSRSCEEFIEALASRAPVPGGGGASALVGALGTALGNMVGSLTVGNPRYVEVQDDIVALKAKADALQDELVALVARDAVVFEPLSRAYGLPKDTEEQRAHKAEVMEGCLRECCAVPLEIMERCRDAIALHEQFAEKGTAIAISDVGVGVAFVRAALLGAALNVFINTKSMKDRGYAEDVNQRTHALIDECVARADALYADVAAGLTGPS
jgi:formiminotetrahydrofolate cyclodeaminase